MERLAQNSGGHSFFEVLAFLARYRWILLTTVTLGVGFALYVYVNSQRNPGRIDWDVVAVSQPLNAKQTAISASMFVDLFAHPRFLDYFYSSFDKNIQPSISVPQLVKDSLEKEIGLISAKPIPSGEILLHFRWPRTLADTLSGDSVASSINLAIQRIALESRQPFVEFTGKWLELEMKMVGIYQQAMRKFPNQKPILENTINSERPGIVRRPPFFGLLSLISSLPESDPDKDSLFKTYAEIFIQQEPLDLAKDRLRSQFGLMATLDFSPVAISSEPVHAQPFRDGIKAIPSILIVLGGIFGGALGLLFSTMVHYWKINRDSWINAVHARKG